MNSPSRIQIYIERQQRHLLRLQAELRVPPPSGAAASAGGDRDQVQRRDPQPRQLQRRNRQDGQTTTGRDLLGGARGDGGVSARADKKSQVRQCLSFCTADFLSSFAYESAEQKTNIA